MQKSLIWGLAIIFSLNTKEKDTTIAKLYYNKVSNNDFVLSSSISDNLVLLSNETSKYFLANSSYFDESNIQPFSKSFKKASDYLVRAKYIVEMPAYEGVLYDKYRRVYYRIGKLPVKVVSIFDENFQKIGEQELPKYGELNYGMIFISKEGLCIANKKKHSENDNFLTFDVFELYEK